MKIYIASSWRNQHGVELLTAALRHEGHEVLSWIENNQGENGREGRETFEEWLATDRAYAAFEYDTTGAAECDIFIYYGPAGKDAAVELGIAYANSDALILGLEAKGEDLGLMRKCVDVWCPNVGTLLDLVRIWSTYDIDDPAQLRETYAAVIAGAVATDKEPAHNREPQFPGDPEAYLPGFECPDHHCERCAGTGWFTWEVAGVTEHRACRVDEGGYLIAYSEIPIARIERPAPAAPEAHQDPGYEQQDLAPGVDYLNTAATE